MKLQKNSLLWKSATFETASLTSAFIKNEHFWNILSAINKMHVSFKKTIIISWTHPRDNQLSSQILNFSLDFTADVELMAIQGDALQVGEQVLLTGRVGTLEGGRKIKKHG
ncbi:hypothetical protein AMECASPLE_015673 [Ameca splendens]|uniref:Uncharacterized protein n=1 Tax=Ameca splendens TaxID=208324 RepID=A0ABV0ZAS7_9TELE